MQELLSEVLDGLSDHSLSTDRFEHLVDFFWNQGEWIQSGKAASTYVSSIQQEIPSLSASDYGKDTQILFKSHHLYGQEGTSGAIHIQAPPEEKQSPLLADKNRAPHVHGSGRISVITKGKAIFYIHRNINGYDYVIEAPVSKNDIIFCPSGCAHTFDAGTDGFSLVSAMAAYHPPSEDDYAIDALTIGLNLDAMPCLAYAEYQQLIGDYIEPLHAKKQRNTI